MIQCSVRSIVRVNYLVHFCRIFTVSKDNEAKANLSEQWYGVRFGITKISKSRVIAWKTCGLHPELRFPAKNKFIPTELDLKTGMNPFHPDPDQAEAVSKTLCFVLLCFLLAFLILIEHSEADNKFTAQ
jgi:secreted Zn-dependent insulinase-like peptidase